MGSNLQFKRGIVGRELYTPISGEPLWQSDEKKLYIGNNVKAGGMPATLTDADIISFFPKFSSGFIDIEYTNYGISFSLVDRHRLSYIRFGDIVFYSIEFDFSVVSAGFVNFSIVFPVVPSQMSNPDYVAANHTDVTVDPHNDAGLEFITVSPFSGESYRILVFGKYLV